MSSVRITRCTNPPKNQLPCEHVRPHIAERQTPHTPRPKYIHVGGKQRDNPQPRKAHVHDSAVECLPRGFGLCLGAGEGSLDLAPPFINFPSEPIPETRHAVFLIIVVLGRSVIRLARRLRLQRIYT